MTLIFRSEFNNTLKTAAQDKVVNKSELDSLKIAAKTKDEKYLTNLMSSDNDNLKLKFKVKETAISAIDYSIQIKLNDPEPSKPIYSTSTIDITNHEIIAIPEHKSNSFGVKVPEQVYIDFPNLKALDGILKVEDYDNLLIRKNVEELAKLPSSLLSKLKDLGLKQVEISNKSVVEMAENSELRGQQPRNWEATVSWDDVPGVYNPGDKSVAVGIGPNGSEALALHEIAHAIGDLFKLDKSSEMVEHHKRLYNKLDTYLKGIGDPGNSAGTEEMFAEGIAVLLDEGEQKAVSRFDQNFVNFLKKEVLGNIPVSNSKFDDLISMQGTLNNQTQGSNIKYNNLLSLDNQNNPVSKNNTEFNHLMGRLDS